MSAPPNGRKSPPRAQLLLNYLVLTAGIGTGLALYFSASTLIDLLQIATRGLLLPLLLALVAAFFLDPLVTLVEREEINRSTSIFIVYLLLSSALFLLIQQLLPYWEHMWLTLNADLPRYSGRLVEFLKEQQATLQTHFPFIEKYNLPALARKATDKFVSDMLLQTPRSVLTLGSLLLLVPLFTFFFLRDGHRIMRSCTSLAPNRYFEMVHDLFYLVSRQLGLFIRGRLLEAAIVGLVVTGGLLFTDIRYAPLLGLFAGITNLIPYVGPLIGMVPGLLIALIDLGYGGQFWWIVIVYFVIAQVIVDNFILIPILISRVSNLHPLWVILAIVMGGKLLGVVGMIIGVPVASVIKITLVEIRHYRSAFALPESFPDSERKG